MQKRKETLYVWKPKSRDNGAWYQNSWSYDWIICETTGRWMLDEYDNLFLEVKYLSPVYERVSFIKQCRRLFICHHWEKVKDKEMIAYEHEDSLLIKKDKIYFSCGETE